MIRRFKYALLALMMVITTSLAVVPAVASANFAGDACGGVNQVDSSQGCGSGSNKKLTNVLQLAVNILSFVVGFVAIIMIIISGFKYITSSGDSNNIASAKTTLIYAIVGLVIAALAQVIVRFTISHVLNKK